MESTEQFVNHDNFDKDGKVRKLDVPLLAMVPVPAFQMDEVDVTFDMEVKGSGN